MSKLAAYSVSALAVALTLSASAALAAQPNGAHDTFLNRVAVPASPPVPREIPLAEGMTPAVPQTSAVGKGL